MKDPLGGFLRTREFFLSYLDTAFRIRNDDVAQERRDLLRREGQLCAGPILEPLPRYQTAGLKIDQLVDEGAAYLPGFDRNQRQAFVDLATAGLFDSKREGSGRVGTYELYQHQLETLERGVQAGRPAVVASGTGSGKTESFLMPILAMLAREALTWPEPSSGYLDPTKRWWCDATGEPYARWSARDRSAKGVFPRDRRPTKTTLKKYKNRDTVHTFRVHRYGEAEGRPRGVRALILYPMNALVEDQLTRLRKALDSELTARVCQNLFNKNRIFFGRYTGATPVTGWDVHPRVHPKDDCARRDRQLGKLFEALRETEYAEKAARDYDEARGRDRFESEGLGGDFATWYSSLDPAEREDVRFAFPSARGAELCSRWDMQMTPPDILITNVSMLNAMLTREVDSTILQQTKDWIARDEGYFFLVLDELHLQRGAAGTETAMLLRVLLERLGLTAPGNRHKLRILASSASLPLDAEIPPGDTTSRRDRSLQYLWDFYGRNGTYVPSEQGSFSEAKRESWEDAVIGGTPREVGDPLAATLTEEPFVRYLRASAGEAEAVDGEPYAPLVAVPASPTEAVEEWAAVIDALRGDGSQPMAETVRAAIERAGEVLERACVTDSDDERVHLQPKCLTHVAGTLFGSADAFDALRGLTLVRGAAELFRDWYPGSRVPDAPAVRLHTFFRSIEGLFATVEAPVEEDSGHLGRRFVGPMSIERTSRLTRREGEDRKRLRQFELLYCECCGELFVAGTPGQGSTDGAAELLPMEPNLDGLPELAGSQRFEELSYRTQRVFWPTSGPGEEPIRNRDARDHWWAAQLDPVSGEVRKVYKPTQHQKNRDFWGGVRDDIQNGWIGGWLYVRLPGVDFHDRRRNSGGANVPYACPACGTDYSGRRDRTFRLSPIRNFRTGFAKTTQLLATEVFDVLKRESGLDGAKLVSFSDSRQEAAKTALDIERNHHQDLRRYLLIEELSHVVRQKSADRERSQELGTRLAEVQAAYQRALGSYDQAEMEALGAKRDALERRIAFAQSADDSLPIDEVASLDPLRDVPRLVRRFAAMGIHPSDPDGVERYRLQAPGGATGGQPSRRAGWTEILDLPKDSRVVEPTDIRWARPMAEVHRYQNAQRDMLFDAQRFLAEILFNKTYFGLEEACIGYVTVGAMHRSEEARERAAALIRVLGDSYRYIHSPYRRSDQAPPNAWGQAGVVPLHSRVRRFAAAIANASGADENVVLDDMIRSLSEHEGLVIHNERVRVKFVDDDHPTWSCDRCRRTHLHRGYGSCTRCFHPLPAASNGTARETRNRNFLSRRLFRDESNAFRLHCEELTGQTDDPLERQVKFKGLLVRPLRPKLEWTGGRPQPVFDENGDLELESVELYGPKEEIDLLAVTTTMEVGIDIGPLQGILQANMPPQRFNYQQRVGRAGRRGQAFSIAATLCRTKSHDLYYFRYPELITGEEPPPPFLNKDMDTIALRLLRKAWLWKAFDEIRSTYGEYDEGPAPDSVFPADQMSPPDIHGEFLNPSEWLGWTGRVAASLADPRVVAHRLSVASVVSEDCEALSAASLETKLDGEDLLARIGKTASANAAASQKGLAQCLAEDGLFPMFGMPTRVRPLYTGTRPSRSRNRREWAVIDRDLDLAIYEFAPGRTVTKDKQEHLCLGVVGSLPEMRGPEVQPIAPAFRPPFWLLECESCGSWVEWNADGTVGLAEPDEGNLGECGHCGEEITKMYACREPLGFRTDFWPKSSQEPDERVARHRLVQAEAVTPPTNSHPDSNLLVAFGGQTKTFRLNRGRVVEPDDDDDTDAQASPSYEGFNFESGDWRFWSGRSQRDLKAADRPDDRRHYIETGVRPNHSSFQADGAGFVGGVTLAAPKTTDLVQILAQECPAHLRLTDIVRGRTRYDPAVRAAAISATFLLVNRAARALDTDPDEFEVIEPRLARDPEDEDLVRPVLQFADRLVNGAGFSRQIATPDSEGKTQLGVLLEEIVTKPNESPRRELFSGRHAEDCEFACYECLMRYGNQSWHGLLDWRLGLAYLEALWHRDYGCGLDDDFEHPHRASLHGWPKLAETLAKELAARVEGWEATSIEGTPLTAIRGGEGGRNVIVIVTHPMWNVEEPGDLLELARLTVGESDSTAHIDYLHTFDLVRRPISMLDLIRQKV